MKLGDEYFILNNLFWW